MSTADHRAWLLSDFKSLFTEFLNNDSSMSVGEKSIYIQFFDDRVITLPDKNVESIFELYHNISAKPNHPYYDYVIKGVFDSFKFTYILDGDWKNNAKRIRRRQAPEQRTVTKKLLRSINKIENRIRSSHREHLVFLDIDGCLLFEDIGTHDKCGDYHIPKEVSKKIYVGIHNHPLALNPFSPDDLSFAFYLYIPINRVVTLDGTYELIFGEELLSNHGEITRILAYYNNIIDEQIESEEYKGLYEMLYGNSKIGRVRKRIHDKCKESGDYTKSYDYDKANGFLELNKKSLLEAMDQTSKFFGLKFTFYPKRY